MTHSAPLRHHRRPRRCGCRSHHRRPRRPDLPDRRLQLPRHRSCRRPVRPARVRQHLLADHEPHQRRPRAAHRAARRRQRGAGARPRATPPRFSACSTSPGPATPSSRRRRSTAAPGTSSCTRSVASASRCASSRPPIPRASPRPATTPRRRGSSRRSAIRGSTCPTSPGWPTPAARSTSRCSSTTPSPRPT